MIKLPAVLNSHLVQPEQPHTRIQGEEERQPMKSNPSANLCSKNSAAGFDSRSRMQHHVQSGLWRRRILPWLAGPVACTLIVIVDPHAPSTARPRRVRVDTSHRVSRYWIGSPRLALPG